MTASFGTPAPLPGQPGFRAQPSEAMARETAEMEERLARLKTDLAAEAEMRDAAGPRAKGSRWRSARADRGSVRAYAKDVKIRHKQQLQQRPPHGIFATGNGSGGAGLGGGKAAQPQAGAGARAAAALREEQQQRQQHQQYQQHQHQHQQHQHQQPQAETRQAGYNPAASISTARPTFKTKEVSRWGVGDTVEWLMSLGLGKHAGVFQQNEISGPILLEVGLDDLDYMDVRVLAHRKCILKGIEDLRRGGGRAHSSVDTPPPPAPTAESIPKLSTSSGSGRRNGAETEAASISTPQSADCRAEGDDRSSPATRKKQHWSAVKPLAETPTKGDARDSLTSVNLADGHYDEAAARSSFAAAVAEWRGEGRNSTATTTNTGASAKEAPPPSFHRPSVVGRAPLAGMPAAERPEQDTSRASRGIKRGLLGGGEGSCGAKECWTNPFASPRAVGGETGAAAAAALAGDEPTPADPEPDASLSPRRTTKTVIVVDDNQRETPRVGQSDAPALDEEAEHEAFRRAVAEWNRGGGGRTPTAARKGGGASRDGGVGASDPVELSGASTGTETLPGRRTTEAMAAELREQMDAEHRLQAKELEEKKRALLEGLETAARQEAGRAGDGVAGEDRASSSQDGRSPGDSGGGGFGRYGSEKGQRSDEGDDRSTLSSTTSSAGSSAAHGSCEGHVDDAEGLEERGAGGDYGRGGGVEVEMMDSVLGADWSVEEGRGYVVDEAESGEET